MPAAISNSSEKMSGLPGTQVAFAHGHILLVLLLRAARFLQRTAERRQRLLTRERNAGDMQLEARLIGVGNSADLCLRGRDDLLLSPDLSLRVRLQRGNLVFQFAGVPRDLPVDASGDERNQHQALQGKESRRNPSGQARS